ncbi:MAG TPA: NAD-dependent epimerase/dehydratase family protein [Hypericibacter adhaerens]|uniref:NAD-dependent epimerase/dehydratase family protein n=1 Tax=Hypericibacter adhaerens TaxID=2602016 RepID=UPI002C1258A3|nr:NAD-dependent epimerase/dehydratase family protein [Hypericibacter adhaerens]HWA45258.1 NAD-dependent epimerase/dehydratase family protein [Hypericibacter adhaerens]
MSLPPLLLLGGTDPVGRFVIERAAPQRTVIVIGRSKPWREGVEWHRADLGHGAIELPRVAARHAIATLPVWLLAPHLPALARLGVERLVAFSSTSVDAKRDSRDPAAQAIVTALAEGEAAVAAAAARAGIGLTILRPTLIYGTGEDANVGRAARFIERFGFFPVAWQAEGKRQPVHAEDLALAALAALDRPQAIGRTYALPGGETLSYRAMIERIFAALGRPPRLIRVPGLAAVSDLAKRMARDQAFDIGPAARDLGYAPRRFLSGGRRDLGL